MSALLKTIDDYSEVIDSSTREIPTFLQSLVLPNSSTYHHSFNDPKQVDITTDFFLNSRDKDFVVVKKQLPQTAPILKREFILLQQWEGSVIYSDDTTITAIIIDLSNPAIYDHQIVFDKSEISKDDLNLAVPGARFYWAIGYEEGPGIPRQKVSRLRFQRLLGLTRRDISKAKANSSKFKELFN